ncbi:MAG TPA: carbohydrate-binding protein, partial [Clostridiales bacterium]|nr:carbohydrate-binding protein [Clostridiales bacterium]
MLLENMPTVPHPKADIYYASDAELSGGARIEIANRGYTGKGYVSGYYDSSTACTTFTVEVPTDGEYFISLRYAAGAAGNWSSDRVVGLSINGAEKEDIPFKSISPNWDVWLENVQKIRLRSGKNSIAYMAFTENDNSDCINIDKLSVWPFYENPSIDAIVFQRSDYSVSEKYSIDTGIYEVDSNGMQSQISSIVTYSSSNTSVAVVDEIRGKITGIMAGTANIIAKTPEFTAEASVTVLANPTISVDCDNKKRQVDPSTFGYILTPNYDVPDSRMTLLGPLLNRETIPVQTFQAIGDLDASYYAYEGSILQRYLEAYKRVRSVGYKWYMLLGMNPSWATSSGSPIETFENKETKSDEQQARFKQYIKDVLQYFKDNGAKPDFANLTNEYWTGTEKTFKGNWEAVREVYPDFIPTVGPGAVGFAGIPDYYIPFASENNITLEGPCWHAYWVNDRYVTYSQLKEWRDVIAQYQEKYPETNGKYIIWEENNAGSKDPTDWTRSMANVIRTGVTQNIKGCLEPRNANGMSDLITTNVLEQNPAARRPLWWVYYMFGLMSGYYVDIITDSTEDFTAAACVDINETKIIFAKNDCEGLVHIKLGKQPYLGESIKADLYKIVYSENNGLKYQYSIPVKSEEELDITIDHVGANETWMVVVKKINSTPSFFFPIGPDDGEAATSKPTFTWSKAQDATSYTLRVSMNKDLSNPVIYEKGIIDTSYTVTSELLLEETYYWHVSAENEFGSTSASNNTVYSFKVKANVNVPGQFGPYLPSVNAPNESVTPEFKWSVAYNATSYRLVISKNPDMSDPIVNVA